MESEDQPKPKVEFKPKLLTKFGSEQTVQQEMDMFDELTKRGWKLNLITGEYWLP